MLERVMWAKFIGSDRSCGFRTGNSYRVKLNTGSEVCEIYGL